MPSGGCGCGRSEAVLLAQPLLLEGSWEGGFGGVTTGLPGCTRV